jgi:branched-chain amino acid transport system substrate-binding protein
MRSFSRAVPLRAVLVAGIAAAAFGGISSVSTAKTAHAAAGTTVDFYSSLPLQGGSSADTLPIVQAIKLALSQAGDKAGSFGVKYTSLDDSIASTGAWDPTKTGANAKEAAGDSKAVYYIGEFNSGASEVSLPILNTAGIAQDSPSNTYAGLTVNSPTLIKDKATLPGEPKQYYPSGKKTYFRVVPIDTIQAATDLDTLKAKGCTKLGVINDEGAYGEGVGALLSIEAPDYGMKVVYNEPVNPTTTTNYSSIASAIQAAGAQCFEDASSTYGQGTASAKAVNAVLPHAYILGPDGLCDTSWTQNTKGGLAVPASLLPHLLCTQPALSLTSLPGGKSFAKAFIKAYGKADKITTAAEITPYSIYGYATAQVGLQALAKIKPGGNLRAKMVAAIHSTTFKTVIGKFKFDASGDLTSTAYGVYTFNSKGVPVFYKTVTPTKYLHLGS